MADSFNERAKKMLKAQRQQLTESYSRAYAANDKAGQEKYDRALQKNSRLLKLAYDGELRRKKKRGGDLGDGAMSGS